jgi:hypothetical protein
MSFSLLHASFVSGVPKHTLNEKPRKFLTRGSAARNAVATKRKSSVYGCKLSRPVGYVNEAEEMAANRSGLSRNSEQKESAPRR